MSSFAKRGLLLSLTAVIGLFLFQNCAKKAGGDSSIQTQSPDQHGHIHHEETSSSIQFAALATNCVVSPGIECTPRHGLRVKRNGYNQIRLQYFDKAADVEVSRWATMQKTPDQILNILKQLTFNIEHVGFVPPGYPYSAPAYNSSSRSLHFPLDMTCGDNTGADQTGLTFIHEMDHALAHAFGLSYWQNVGPGHAAGGTWNGLNINGTLISPQYYPNPRYEPYCIEEPVQICTPNQPQVCNLVPLPGYVMGLRTCNATGTAWSECAAIPAPTYVCQPGSTRDCDEPRKIQTCNADGQAWGECRFRTKSEILNTPPRQAPVQ